MASSSNSMRVGIISHIEVMEKINQLEDEVRNILDEPRSVSRLLLYYFNWEKKTLLEAISKDKDGTLQLVKNSEID